jgi:hypothetical protein
MRITEVDVQVGMHLVVVSNEAIELALELVFGFGRILFGDELFHRLVEGTFHYKSMTD